MTRATKSVLDEVKKAELKRISDMNVLSFRTVREVQRIIKERLPLILSLPPRILDVELTRLVEVIRQHYGVLFDELRSSIIAASVNSGLEQKYIVEQTLGEKVNWRKQGADLPRDFVETRRILSERSVLRRNKKQAERIAVIIKESVDKGTSIPEIQKKVDIELGLRDKKGRTSKKALAALKEGKFAHSNGHFYQTYRIARTEGMRVASLQTLDTFEQLKAKGRDVRLRMLAVLDSRTREQSVAMNGQLSDENGEFLYPNGRRYVHGRAPAQYSINDRETTVIEFSGSRGTKEHASLQSFKRTRGADLVK